MPRIFSLDFLLNFCVMAKVEKLPGIFTVNHKTFAFSFRVEYLNNHYLFNKLYFHFFGRHTGYPLQVLIRFGYYESDRTQFREASRNAGFSLLSLPQYSRRIQGYHDSSIMFTTTLFSVCLFRFYPCIIQIFRYVQNHLMSWICCAFKRNFMMQYNVCCTKST